MSYFLTKFPTRRLSLMLLKDFIVTLKQNFPKNLRFDYFLSMCSLNSIKHRSGTDTEIYMKTHRLRLKCLALSKTFRFYAKIALEVKTGAKTFSAYLLPNHENNNNNLIPLAEAKALIERLLREEGFLNSQARTCSEEFDQIAENDLISRMVRREGMNAEENVENKFVSFDAFSCYLLECSIKRLCKRIKALCLGLKMVCKSRYESRITFEAFFDAVSPHQPHRSP